MADTIHTTPWQPDDHDWDKPDFQRALDEAYGRDEYLAEGLGLACPNCGARSKVWPCPLCGEGTAGLVGFWNVTPDRLRIGDELRLRVMGGEEFVTVAKLRKARGGWVRAYLEGGSHTPVDWPGWVLLEPGEKLVVRR